jgi:hypothetical protein
MQLAAHSFTFPFKHQITAIKKKLVMRTGKEEREMKLSDKVYIVGSGDTILRGRPRRRICYDYNESNAHFDQVNFVIVDNHCSQNNKYNEKEKLK